MFFLALTGNLQAINEFTYAFRAEFHAIRRIKVGSVNGNVFKVYTNMR